MKEKVVLAYSGGLDTTAIIPWLKENFDYEVICCCIDCGQGEELDGLEERAKLSGASKLYIEDIVDDFCDNYIVPCVQGHAVYENKYLLGTSMARPAIAKRLVEIARKEGASAICHGATGKGNDQIRFEPTASTFLSTRATATAATGTCGTSAMKGLSLRIPQTSRTTAISSYLALRRRMPLTNQNMSP